MTSLTRNTDGSVDTLTDPEGQDTEFAYDTLGRLSEVTCGVGQPDELSVSYTLDDNGNLTAMTDAAGSSTWTYDANNRVTAESRTQNGVTKSAAYAYFANGTLHTLTTFAAQTVSFGYDNALRLISQTDPANGGGTISFGYDARSRRTTISYPSGVIHTQTYDAGDRVASITLEQANGSDLQSFSYDYGFDGSGATPPRTTPSAS